MTDFISYQMPVVHAGGPEKHQGVYREKTVGVPSGTADSYTVMMAYLVQCWAKLHHQSGVYQAARQLSQTGEGFVDSATDGRFENWQISHVLFDILEMPSGYDMVFGADPLIYVGRCSFIQSANLGDSLDWTLGGPSIGFGFQAGFTINEPDNAAPGSWDEYREAVAQEQDRKGLLLQARITRENILSPRDFRAPARSFSVWGSVQPAAKAAPEAKAHGRYHYPLEWINFGRSIFAAPNPNCTGIWWLLKPGVRANITILGLQQEPSITAGGGEVSTSNYNPLKGGDI